MDRERRLVRLHVLAGEDVGVGGRGATQRPGGELAVLEDLGVTKRHLLTGGPANA